MIGPRWLLTELSALGPMPLDVENGPTRAELETELSFMDGTGEPPASLPTTSMWVATAWQILIAADELPRLARVITGAPEPGTNPIAGAKDETDRSPAGTVSWARELPLSCGTPSWSGPSSTRARCPEERLDTTEKGTPLMVRTLTKAAASTAAALSSIRQLPGVARPAVTTVHTIALGGYRVANTAKARPRNLIVVGLVLLALGFPAATQAIDLLGLSGLILAAIGGYLVTFGVWQRGGRLFGALIAFTVTAAVGALAAPVVRQSLFGTSETDGGWLGQKVYWFATDWWHPLLAVGILLLIIFLAGLAISTGRPKNRRQLPRVPGTFQRKRRRLWRKLKAL